ncbi:hypothetical protein ACIBCT_25925 [Streptosporangium sp. NPDC050855]|uniref:hypothetical protein n=1 Tax=Streptosporangium sp. NPDC050855 TaxID=3366194 RepID=UPI0037B77218
MSHSEPTSDQDVPLADRRADQQDLHEEPDFADEFAPSPTDPAGQPEDDPNTAVHGEDEGYDRPTSS